MSGYISEYNLISKIYKNNGNNTFSEQTGISLPGVYDGSVACGDYDNDGDLDILLTGYTHVSFISRIYRNDGNNNFTEQTEISLPEVAGSLVAWGDYDNDGNLDILLTGYKDLNSPISKIYKNNGNNTFSEQLSIWLTGVENGSVAWGDYDNDGDLDILLTGYTRATSISKIYRNDGNNTFTEQTGISLTGVTESSVAWGDYDNDGDLDILLTGWTGTTNISKIYKNEGSTLNTRPTAPAVSMPIVNKSNVTLSWGKATDSQTPSNGLTYNLCIKKLSNDSLAMSPMSDLRNGFRRIVQYGNINQVLSITQNLDYGEYEWYIQSVDNCFSGSVFSKGQNFITSPLSPTNLSSYVTSLTEINLTWVDNSNFETGYIVERSIGNNQNFSPIATLNSNITSYNDKGLTKETQYFYRVKAITNGLFSNYSNETEVIIIFVEQTGISLIGVASSSVAWGDYDNDGDLDILLSSKIYKNNGNNTFTEQKSISLPSVYDCSVAWGDYDNDGDLDILLTGWTGTKHISRIFRNDGNNTFSEQTGISLTGVDHSSVAWGDYDNDGDLDILLTGQTVGSSNNISKIYKNNGNNTFTEQTEVSLTGVSYGSVAWGDYDNDGDIDILLTGGTDSGFISKIYKNNGNNTFTEQTGISLTGVFKSSVAWGDYDNDGYLDILLTGYTISGPISKIYKNNGNNTFTEQTGISLTGVSEGSVAWGDYDNDGDLDILLTGYSSSYNDIVSKIYKNNGNNTFTEQTGICLTGVYLSSAAWGDYDNDGDLDILLTGITGYSQISKIYKNECSKVNTPPSSSGNLVQMVSNNNITFTWDKATDMETPQNGLSYNLVIQSNDGEILKSPLSDLTSGFRKVISIGNVGQNNSWTIKDLSEGIYSWSVQAIDHNYAGSPFAPSGTFGIYPVGVNETLKCKGLVEVYPNPVSQNLTVISDDNGTSVDYELSDLSGRVIRKGNFIGKKVIETDSFNPGVYLLKIDNEKTSEIVKIIKE